MKKFSRICVALLLLLSLLLPCIPAVSADVPVHSGSSTVSGVWVSIGSSEVYESASADITQEVNFVSGGQSFNTIYADYYSAMGLVRYIYYRTSTGDSVTAFNLNSDDGWEEQYKTVDFGTTPQPVTSEFYTWFTKCYTPVSSGPVTGAVTVYTTDGSYEIADFEGTFPVSVAVTDTGLSFYWADDSSSVYQFDGTDIFTGVSLSANESEPRYTVGRTFTMESPGSLYIHTEEPPVSDLQLWDSTGSSMIVEYPGGFPLIVVVTDTGLNLSFDDMYFVYTYSGSDDFYGVAFSPGLSAPTYRSGDRFTMTDPAKLYVYTDSGSTGTDPTDPDETDPTDPTESDPTDPTENPLDQEKDEANNQGNSSVDQVIDIIPDYSDNFLGAIQKLADALGYQGTRAVLPTPEIAIPAMPGLFPEMVVLQSNEIDFEYWCNQIPVNWMTLIRALFDIALVLFCFKELYSMVEFAVSLRSSKKVGED